MFRGSSGYRFWIAVAVLGGFARPWATDGVPALAAQEYPLSIEVRSGFSVPTGELSAGQRGIGTRVGLTLGTLLTLRPHPRAHLYAGWSRHGFDCRDGPSCSPDSDIASRGFEAGARLVLPHVTRAVPWVRFGVLVHSFSYSLDGVTLASDRTPGVEVGGGVDVTLGRHLSLTPEIRYGRYTADLNLQTLNQGAERFQVSFFAIDVGARLRF